MSEEAKPVCVACKLPIEREQRPAGHAGSGQFSHWNDAQCITALRAALDQERADSEKLRAFAQHTGAWCGQNMGHACTCGLSELLAACERRK